MSLEINKFQVLAVLCSKILDDNGIEIIENQYSRADFRRKIIIYYHYIYYNNKIDILQHGSIIK